MDKAERQELAPAVKIYLKDTLKQIRLDLNRMLADSPENAVTAHYIWVGLDKLEGMIQADISARTREEHDAGKVQ